MKQAAELAARASLQIEAEAIAEVSTYMDWEAFEKALEALKNAGSIVTSASGTSGVAAKKFSHSLCCIEKNASFLSPSEAVHGGLGRVKRGDCVVLVSRGGKTAELLPILAVCRKKGATLITLTENKDAPLGRDADIILPLKISRESDPLNIMATGSFLATVAIFDALLAALIAEEDFTLEQFALIHPGGAVGAKLNS